MANTFIYGFHDVRVVDLFEAILKAHGIGKNNPDVIDHLLQLHVEAMEEQRAVRKGWWTTFTLKLAALIYEAHARTQHIKAFPDLSFGLPPIDLHKGLEALAIEYAQHHMPNTYKLPCSEGESEEKDPNDIDSHLTSFLPNQ